jgi:hypothetical protein
MSHFNRKEYSRSEKRISGIIQLTNSKIYSVLELVNISSHDVNNVALVLLRCLETSKWTSLFLYSVHNWRSGM